MPYLSLIDTNWKEGGFTSSWSLRSTLPYGFKGRGGGSIPGVATTHAIQSGKVSKSMSLGRHGSGGLTTDEAWRQPKPTLVMGSHTYFLWWWFIVDDFLMKLRRNQCDIMICHYLSMILISCLIHCLLTSPVGTKIEGLGVTRMGIMWTLCSSYILYRLIYCIAPLRLITLGFR